MSKDISILVATRPFRPERITSFLKSFMENTEDLTRIEILVKVDDDCRESLNTVNSYSQILPVKAVVMNGGWRRTGLMRYWNKLGELSSGKILWFMNDRCVIDCESWEQKLLPYLGRASEEVLALYPEPGRHPALAGMCPIVSSRWIEVLGCVTKYNAADVFMNTVIHSLPSSLAVRVPDLRIDYAHPWEPYPEPSKKADSLGCDTSSSNFMSHVDTARYKIIRDIRITKGLD